MLRTTSECVMDEQLSEMHLVQSTVDVAIRRGVQGLIRLTARVSVDEYTDQSVTSFTSGDGRGGDKLR